MCPCMVIAKPNADGAGDTPNIMSYLLQSINIQKKNPFLQAKNPKRRHKHWIIDVLFNMTSKRNKKPEVKRTSWKQSKRETKYNRVLDD